MGKQNFLKNIEKPVALVSVLDWGLGHATRCIPIINELIENNFEVIIAADGHPLMLLKSEFPNTEFLELKGYKVQYSKKSSHLAARIIAQLPKIIRQISFEKKWLKVLLKERQIDLVISDNRPGLHNPAIPCIYITHQLNIKTGSFFSDKIATYLHRRIISKFDVCWIPDAEQNGLSGDLSHKNNSEINRHFIGPLSRFFPQETKSCLFDLSIILSGPEPQRTIFENQILQEIQGLKIKIFIARGLPNETKSLKCEKENIIIKNHITSQEMNQLINSSKWVISRCGYSSVMDYARVRAKAILVPTPGQGEQEYLGNYLSQMHYFLVIHENGFDIKNSLHDAEKFDFAKMNFDFDAHKSFVAELATSIKNKNFAAQKI